MYYVIYKVTNKVTGKFYIGKHQTNDVNDSYMGSGKLIMAAIKKHGANSFKKEILYCFDNEDDMNAKEAELVTEEFVMSPTNYNLCPGGKGGFGYINNNDIPKFKGKSHTDEAKKKISDARQGFQHTDEAKKKISDANNRTNGSRGEKTSAALKGRPKTESHKNKISAALMGKQKNYPDNRKRRELIQHQKEVCPYCNKVGGSNVMKRWHFKNCKQYINAEDSLHPLHLHVRTNVQTIHCTDIFNKTGIC